MPPRSALSIQSLLHYTAAMFLALAILAAWSGQSRADTYVVWLKDATGTPYLISNQKCAVGSFQFTKAGGSGPAQVTLRIQPLCIPGLSQEVVATFSSTMTVDVRNITLKDQDQGLNVDGVTGNAVSNIINPSAPAAAQLRFLVTMSSTAGANGAPGTRTFSLFRVRASNNQIVDRPINGDPYHLFNASQPLPEPETLLLLLGGLGALALARRHRARRGQARGGA